MKDALHPERNPLRVVRLVLVTAMLGLALSIGGENVSRARGCTLNEYFVVDYQPDESNIGKVVLGGPGTEAASNVTTVVSARNGHVDNYRNSKGQLVVHVKYCQ